MIPPDSGASDFTISYEDRGDYLYARVSGQRDTVANSLAYWREISDEARRRGSTRVLVVEAFVSPSPLMDVYQVAEQIPTLIRGLIVAFVDERFEQFEENKFGEDVAVNRGAVGKVFSRIEPAVEWLRQMTT